MDLKVLLKNLKLGQSWQRSPQCSHTRSYKAEGHKVLIMAHRPAAIKECDLLLVLEGGAKRTFGPKEDVLRATVQNTESLMRSQALGGMT